MVAQTMNGARVDRVGGYPIDGMTIRSDRAGALVIGAIKGGWRLRKGQPQKVEESAEGRALGSAMAMNDRGGGVPLPGTRVLRPDSGAGGR